MFYVVFFVDLKKNFIVPKQWIKNIKLHKEKFYNNSLNSNQIFTCFYTNNEGAFDEEGLPKGDFLPNFTLPLRCSFDGADDDEVSGLFRVKLKAFKGNKINYLRRKSNRLAKRIEY